MDKACHDTSVLLATETFVTKLDEDWTFKEDQNSLVIHALFVYPLYTSMFYGLSNQFLV